MPKRLRWNEKQYQIYALIDPIDGLALYVGKSEDAQSRFVGHLHGGEGLTPLGNDGDTVRSVLLSKHFVRRGEPMRGEISSSLAPVFAR